jgi:transcriptional regulator with XRE-family HTH domain
MPDAQMDRLNDLLEASRLTTDYQLEAATIEFAEALDARMQELSVSRSDLASLMGVSRPMVTKLLRSGSNLTMRTMVAAAAALDCTVAVSLSPRAAAPIVASSEGGVRRRPIHPAA